MSLKAAHYVEKLSLKEAGLGLAAGTETAGSWHDEFRGSAYIYVGGLSFDLNEGDLVTVFSQYGRVTRANLIRDSDTGKSKGYAFLCYDDERSTVLAVDNLNGIKLAGRTIQFVASRVMRTPQQFALTQPHAHIRTNRVSHVKQYRKKKDSTDQDEGVVPERPELAAQAKQTATEQQEEQEEEEEIAPAVKRAREEAFAEHSSVAGNEDEESFAMDPELEALEAKIQHAEQRLARWQRKYDKQQHRHKHKHKITEEEFQREKAHIERVLRKLQRRQQELWGSAGSRR